MATAALYMNTMKIRILDEMCVQELLYVMLLLAIASQTQSALAQA